MTKPVTFKVAGPQKGAALIDLVSQKLSVSRNEAKRLIDSRQVFVNAQRIWMARHKVSVGDRIEINHTGKTKSESSCEIIWQDEYYLIANKPSGLLSNGSGSVEEILGKQTGKPLHAVHRLDRDTSGCMLLAWKKPDMELMIPVFQRREVKKIYEGLVIGRIPRELNIINRGIEGEEAVTLLKVVASRGQASRVEFTLVTGRTHQIRRHLNAYDLQLAGEKQYGATVLEQSQLRKFGRHMLHARTLGFPHPKTGKHIEVKAGFPDDYRKAARELGL
ncbi:MAG TPA: RluA family pseudouridine synthase [Kiritimatiellia bacterium]|nr:RluA family pseudouridine synthase [Kiritimatiellia bacterium]